MPEDFEFDVFISYSSKDKEWVRGELLKRIEQAGLKVCIDFRDFKAGRAALLNMQDAVRTSQRTLLVLTPHWFASEWTLFESILVGRRSPAGLKERLIPALRVACEFPDDADFIANLTYVDFTDGADPDLAWRQLLTALGAPLEPPVVKEPKRAGWSLNYPYMMPPNFTGRDTERKMLTRWLNGDPAHPLLVLRALGGFGKSALSWHWLMNDVAPPTWPRVVWWSFYEGDASFDNFLERSVEYLKAGDPAQLGPRQRVDALLKALHQPGTLLVLDGFERLLRAFSGPNAAYQGDKAEESASDRDCISPHAEVFLRGIESLPDMQGKVLLTTRLRPTPVETRDGILLHGCREEELTQLQPADAVEFFRAQGIRGTHTEIEEACAPYGYHPLSLRLLGGLIVRDLQQPGDIAAARHLDVSGDLKQRQHHVLETAYDSLTPARRALLGRIACFRSPMKHEALVASAERESTTETRRHTEKATQSTPSSPCLRVSVVNLDSDLHDLVARGLLHHDPKENRFDLHPIVRRYAYDRLAAPDRAAAHTRLRDYFAAVPAPNKVTRLEDLAPVIELYHHTVRAGQFDEAFTLFRDRLCPNPLYFQFGAYQLIIDLLRALFPDGEDRPPRLKDERDQGWTLNTVANAYGHSGQPRRAADVWQVALPIAAESGKKSNFAIGLGNVATQQLVIGALRAAEANLRRYIALSRELGVEEENADANAELGLQLAYRGAYAESEKELAMALTMFEKRKNVQGQGVTWACRAQRELLLLRSSHSALRTPHSPLEPARRALELADEDARTDSPVERDYVQAHWLLGAAHRVAGQPEEAESHLHEALERCRRINNVENEADILIDLARLRAASGSPAEAQRLVEEALVITERSGYVLQGADAQLELAKLALGRGDKAAAKDHAQKAKALATCDGPPDYTYKAAYDEAGALLRQLGD
ncbi:MAG TPA: toll/interleukin-1 receptor domain-containing protein [Planctomycetota bacterium]|nr:toll/interleukin-1 receptor domain-containing protein [Planctomycetota bacterium]